MDDEQRAHRKVPGRQPQRTEQPARYKDEPGERDEGAGASGVIIPADGSARRER